MTLAPSQCQVFHSVLTRNLGGPSDNDKLLWTVALDTLKEALKVVMRARPLSGFLGLLNSTICSGSLSYMGSAWSSCSVPRCTGTGHRLAEGLRLRGRRNQHRR